MISKTSGALSPVTALRLRRILSLGLLLGFLKEINPRPDVVAVVVEGSAANQIAVNHAGFIDEDSATDF